MHDVMTVHRPTENRLICSTRLHERVAGLLLVAVTLPWLGALGLMLWAGAGLALAPFLLAGLLTFYGLRWLLSSRRFTFDRHSKTCAVHIKILGLFSKRRQFEFSELVVRRRFYWRFPFLLHQLVLVDSSQTPRLAFTMGYAAGCDRAEVLAQTIAAFTDTTALDSTGQPLGLSDPERGLTEIATESRRVD